MSLLLPRPPAPGREESRPSASDYLANYGRSGAFGRFAAASPLGLRRGDPVVLDTPRGRELGTILCPAADTHVRLVTSQGALVRRATADDLDAAHLLANSSQRFFDDCVTLVHELKLGAEIVDVEMLLEGRKAIVHFLGAADTDLAPLVEALAERHERLVFFENASVPAGIEEEEHGGCGQPGCGRAPGGGGCSSCGSGGCSSCGTGKVDMPAYFAHLRTQMENQRRVPLA